MNTPTNNRDRWITEGVCDIPADCPGDVPSCGCEKCFEAGGFWNDGERAEMLKLTPTIDTEWKPGTGYLSNNGCRLERRFRPLNCLMCKNCEYR